jgi:hypothetical protein
MADLAESAVPAPIYGRRNDPALIAAVAAHVEEGLTREEISALPGMPSPRTIETVIHEHPEIASMRARGREIEADRLVREGLEIVDAEIEDPDTASAEVSRARNRFEARKWLAGCFSRDTYGERPPQVNVQVNSNVCTAFGTMSRNNAE